MSHSQKKEERNRKQKKNSQHPQEEVNSYKKLGEEIAKITKIYED